MTVLALALATVRHRPAGAIGSSTAVAFGAAMLGLCAVLFASALTRRRSADPTAADDYVGAIAVFATQGTIAVFATVFVVAATTALSITHRRRDLALLRNAGATPGQVRRLVTLEAVLTATPAAVLGTAVGAVLADSLARVFARSPEIPDGFAVRQHPLPLVISAAVLVVVAYLAASAAGRRAGRLSPAEALTRAETGRYRIGIVRGLLGVLCLAGAVALLLVAATTTDDPGLGVGYAFMDSALALVAVGLLAPVLLRPVAALVGVLGRLTPTGRLAVADIAADPQRTAASAVPTALLVTLNASMVQTSLVAADRGEQGTQTWSLTLLAATTIGFTAIALVNSTAMTVAQRRAQYTDLRLAGATRGQVRATAGWEALLSTATGAVAGATISVLAAAAFAISLQLPPTDVLRPALLLALAGGGIGLALATSTIVSGRVTRDPDLLAATDQ